MMAMFAVHLLAISYTQGVPARGVARFSRSAVIKAVTSYTPNIKLQTDDLEAMVDEWRKEDDKKRLLNEAQAAALEMEVVEEEGGRSTGRGAASRLDRARLRLQRSINEEAGLAPPAIPYDPSAAAARFASQPMAVGMRQMRLLGPLISFILKVIADVQQGTEEKHRDARAAELTELISSLGPAIIKAGQALSSRSDLLPSAYLRELTKLQDRVPPFASAEAHALIEMELGQPLGELFTSLGDEPVAAASLGQVYRGETLDGREVAVKVQRPGVEPTVALDLYILRSYSATLGSIVALLGRNLDFVSVIDDFGQMLYSELDYALEAQNARRFSSLYATIPNVSAPAVLPELSTSTILTMEWVDGVRLTDAEGLRERNLAPSALVDTLVQCSLRQMLDSGFFHADPHAGNLFVKDDGTLVYIDFGMMSFLSSAQRHAIIEAVVHMVNRDFASLAELYQELGFIPPDEDVTPIVAALDDALPDVLNASISELNIKSVVERLGDVMYTYPFSLPPFYVAIIRCLGVLEGVSLQVDDNFAILQDAYPYIASRLLTDRSPRLQRALSALVFRDGKLRTDYLMGLLENAAGSSEYDLVGSAEALADFVLLPESAALLDSLTDQLVDEIDEVGAESASYVFNLLTTLAAPFLGPGGAVAAAAAAAAARDAAGGDASGDSRPRGEREASDPIRALLEQLGSSIGTMPLPPPSPRLARAIKVAETLQKSALTKSVDLTRVGALAATLLARESVQRQLADLTLQLVQRGVQRGIRSLFALPDMSPPVTSPQSSPQSGRSANATAESEAQR